MGAHAVGVLAAAFVNRVVEILTLALDANLAVPAITFRVRFRTFLFRRIREAGPADAGLAVRADAAALLAILFGCRRDALTGHTAFLMRAVAAAVLTFLFPGRILAAPGHTGEFMRAIAAAVGARFIIDFSHAGAVHAGETLRTLTAAMLTHFGCGQIYTDLVLTGVPVLTVAAAVFTALGHLRIYTTAQLTGLPVRTEAAAIFATLGIGRGVADAVKTGLAVGAGEPGLAAHIRGDDVRTTALNTALAVRAECAVIVTGVAGRGHTAAAHTGITLGAEAAAINTAVIVGYINTASVYHAAHTVGAGITGKPALFLDFLAAAEGAGLGVGAIAVTGRALVEQFEITQPVKIVTHRGDLKPVAGFVQTGHAVGTVLAAGGTVIRTGECGTTIVPAALAAGAEGTALFAAVGIQDVNTQGGQTGLAVRTVTKGMAVITAGRLGHLHAFAGGITGQVMAAIAAVGRAAAGGLVFAGAHHAGEIAVTFPEAVITLPAGIPAIDCFTYFVDTGLAAGTQGAALLAGIGIADNRHTLSVGSAGQAIVKLPGGHGAAPLEIFAGTIAVFWILIAVAPAVADITERTTARFVKIRAVL